MKKHSEQRETLTRSDKEKEAQKKTISTNKKLFTDQIKANTNYITVLKEESGKDGLSMEQREQFKTQQLIHQHLWIPPFHHAALESHLMVCN